MSSNRAAFSDKQLASKNGESIPMADLEKGIVEMGKGATTAEQAHDIAKSMDLNNDQVISLEEFNNWRQRYSRSTGFQKALYSASNIVVAPRERNEVYNYLDKYRCFPPPIAILLLTLIEVCIFFYFYFSQPDKTDNSIWTLCAGCFAENHNPGLLMFVPTLRQEAWRFFTYSLLHQGMTHLLSNIIVQMVVGIPLELVHKFHRIFMIYFLAVVAGSLLQYCMDPKVYLVGASAGVYALIGAHVSNVILNWSEMPFRWLRVAIFGAFVTFDFGSAIYRRYFENECDQVSFYAHIAGFLTGVIFGFAILYNVKKETWEKYGRKIALMLYALLFVGLIVFAVVRQPNDKAFETCVPRE